MKQMIMDMLLVLEVVVPYVIAVYSLLVGPAAVIEAREKAIRLEDRINARRARREEKRAA